MNKEVSTLSNLYYQLEDQKHTKDYEKNYASLGTQLEVSEVKAELEKNKFWKTIELTIEEIYQKELYRTCANHQSHVHNERHIENVILYAGLISSLEGFRFREQLLALEAAKYHDIGRTDDGRTPHGLQGAAILSEKLQERFDEDAIAIIQTAVAYHEPDDDLSRLEQLMVKYEVPADQQATARKISLCLKDADALDRTRFFQKGITLDPKFLNHTSARQLVKFACQLQETYAVNELNRLVRTRDQKRMKKQLELQGRLPKEILYQIETGNLVNENPNAKINQLSINQAFFKNGNKPNHRSTKGDSKLQKSRGTKFCAKRH